MEQKNGAFFRVEDLHLFFQTNKGLVKAVDDVNFELNQGRTLVIVGESGCGKSSLAKAILRLLPRNVNKYQGNIFLEDKNIMNLSDEDFRRKIRWIKAAMIPQAAMNSLNPVVKISDQIAEPLLIHKQVKSKNEALLRAQTAFEKVAVPVDFLTRYPFELSGGMRQRVAIAMSLVCDPQLILLDEPTSALDILTQANIMNVLKRIKHEVNTNFILITHDIATSSELADDVAVMYAGQIVEYTDAYTFFSRPRHPYSQKLMASVPSLEAEDEALGYIPGQPPSLLELPHGCRFAKRCHKKFDKCDEEPPVFEVEKGWKVKCWLYAGGENNNG